MFTSTYLRATVIIAGAMTLVAIGSANAVTPPPTSVTVTNTPLPVKMTNSTISATITNTSANPAPVTITNTSSKPVPTLAVGDDVSAYYHSSCNLLLSDPVDGFCNFAAPPAGKVIVVDTFSCIIQESPGGRPSYIGLGPVDGGYDLQLPFTVNPIPGNEDVITVYVPLTRFYTRVAPYIRVGAGLSGAFMPYSTQCTAIGHLVNATS